MVLHILERFFYLIYAVLGAFFGYVVVNAEYHFFIRMAHPYHSLMHINAGVTDHGAIGVP